MPHLRQDPTTDDWIIFSKVRARRPDEFRKEKAQGGTLPAYSPTCPFCRGNESMTPDVDLVVCRDDRDDWMIRVVPNKYPALTPEGTTRRTEKKVWRQMPGYGRHEVVIESPLHNELIPFMSDDHVARLIRAYRDRYAALREDPQTRAIIIFKNHGKGAGTSLEHPHTQIVASPVVPPYVRRKYEVTIRYFDNTGRRLHNDIRDAELSEKTRIITESPHFVALHPFASHYPFETWIMPRRGHQASFVSISEEEIEDLAKVLKDILARLYNGLGNPDYNLIVDTVPVDDEQKSYYLWHIQIIPRLTMTAGFELGSGIQINVALPEETAEFMRNVDATAR
jgi:UDPglucose--hexose-1-phosphate uridylyltransferase